MRKLIGIIAVSLVAVIFAPLWVRADDAREIRRLNGHVYERKGTAWYSRGVHGLFKVDTRCISARIDEPDRRDAVMEMLAAHHLEMIRMNRLGIMDIGIPNGEDPLDLVVEMQTTGLFRYVETNSVGRWEILANDPYFTSQWGHHNTGQSGGTADADIDCPEAWDTETGNPAAVVAVLDSGTDTDHEDLAGNMWANPGEIPGNSVDDDGNGFVDDILGWDFEHNDNDPNGTYFHGTHVAGIVAAISNNGIGVAGVAGGWGGKSPGAQLMCLLVGTDAPQGSILDDAILYAADNGARVITMSLSVDVSQAINDAVDYAFNTRHVFIDCASGNDYGAVAYPANLAEIAAVGATDRNDNKADFSNYGPELELTAPGVDIYSTQIGDTYGSSDGTSFSAPYVAGVAALVFSAVPSMSGQEVRTLLQNTADDLGVSGWDQNYGYGRVNAAAALADTSGVVLDRTAYACGSTVSVTVRDNSASGTVTVSLTTESEPGGEMLTLTETSQGIFEGAIDCTTSGPSGSDGMITVTDGDTLAVYYAPLDKTATAAVDCTAPVISGVTVESVSDSAATITWTTGEPADSMVNYGESSPGQTSTDSALETAHSVTVTGLTSCTDYIFTVTSADAAGNTATDDNGGVYYSFQTQELIVFLGENMDTDPGWTVQGEWAFGQPTGGGGDHGNPDPTGGYTGTNVYGVNLNGDYPNNLTAEYLTTPAFDCSGTAHVEFSFWCWLGVEQNSYDHASIDVSNDNGGTWQNIWANGGSSMNGGAWEQWSFDISAIAAGHSQVKIRWGIGPTDSSWTFCGWNIDDVTVSATQPCDAPCNHDGDVNMNDQITSGDAQLGFAIAIGTVSPSTEEACAADCNGNGEVTAGDAQAIFAAALGTGNCADPM